MENKETKNLAGQIIVFGGGDSFLVKGLDKKETEVNYNQLKEILI